MSKISNMKGVRTAFLLPKIVDLKFTKAAPAQNTWYAAANLQNVELLMLAHSVAVAAETLEVRITLDGIVLTGGEAAIAGTNYPLGLSETSTGLAVTAQNVFIADRATSKHRTVLIEIRKTTALGAGTLSLGLAYLQY